MPTRRQLTCNLMSEACGPMTRELEIPNDPCQAIKIFNWQLSVVSCRTTRDGDLKCSIGSCQLSDLSVVSWQMVIVFSDS